MELNKGAENLKIVHSGEGIELQEFIVFTYIICIALKYT